MEEFASFCDSGISLTKSRSLASTNCFGLSVSEQKVGHKKYINIDVQDDIHGITLEQLNKRSKEQKLQDLEELDWRSQVPYYNRCLQEEASST